VSVSVQNIHKKKGKRNKWNSFWKLIVKVFEVFEDACRRNIKKKTLFSTSINVNTQLWGDMCYI